jgi:hypothetical protein
MSNNNILGIGKAGYYLAKCFERYIQYKVYKIDAEDKKEKRYFKLPKQKTIMDYEINTPDLTSFFKGIKENCLVILGGSGNISGATLSILAQLKDKCKISFLYIKPDPSLLSNMKMKQHEIIYNILQQYTRSDVFKEMYIIDNELVSDEVEHFFDNKYKTINENITFCYHMINTFKNISSLEDNFDEPIGTAKLVSIGYQGFNEEIEKKLLFNLDNLREKRYYFAISEKTLNENKFYNKIKEIIKSQKEQDETIKISYGIYKTQYEEDFIFIEARSSEIQK